MRLLHLVPAALLIALTESVVSAFPSIVAAREGGMGLGSALIVGRVAHLGALAIGAVVAAWAVDRAWASPTHVGGALLFGAGSIGVATQPMHSLDWVIAASALAGAGVGAILTTAFAAAARLPARRRALGIALLLLAPFVGRALIGGVVPAATPGLVVWPALALALALFSAGVWRRASDGPLTAIDGPMRGLSARAAAISGVLLATATVALTAAADPSGVTVVLVAGPLGLGDLEALEVARAWMIAIGIVAGVGGSLILVVSAGSSRRGVTAAAGLALVTAGAGGTLAVLSLVNAGATDLPVGTAIAAAIGAGASIGGIALAGWWLARGGGPRPIAIAGSALVTAGAAFAFPTAAQAALEPGLLLFVTIGAVAVGGGLAAVALWNTLVDGSELPIGLAAAAGVVAATTGSALGSMLGTGEAVRSLTGELGPGGGLILVVAAVVAALASALLPRRRTVAP